MQMAFASFHKNRSSTNQLLIYLYYSLKTLKGHSEPPLPEVAARPPSRHLSPKINITTIQLVNLKLCLGLM
jgi:hypothetical protein